MFRRARPVLLPAEQWPIFSFWMGRWSPGVGHAGHPGERWEGDRHGERQGELDFRTRIPWGIPQSLVPTAIQGRARGGSWSIKGAGAKGSEHPLGQLPRGSHAGRQVPRILGPLGHAPPPRSLLRMRNCGALSPATLRRHPAAFGGGQVGPREHWNLPSFHLAQPLRLLELRPPPPDPLLLSGGVPASESQGCSGGTPHAAPFGSSAALRPSQGA